jgi:hypothetical protein
MGRKKREHAISDKGSREGLEKLKEIEKGRDQELSELYRMKQFIKPCNKNEEVLMWRNTMNLLRDDMKWVLDNLEKLSTYKVSWNTYSRARCRKIQCQECLEFNHVDSKTCKKCKNKLKNHKIHTFGVGKPPKEALK